VRSEIVGFAAVDMSAARAINPMIVTAQTQWRQFDLVW